MPLINCPDCGTEVSDAAPNCPKCNRPIAERSKLWPWVGVIVAFFTYPFVAFIVLEIVDVMVGRQFLPEWVFQPAVALVMVGFVAALALGWWIGQRFRSR